MSKDDSEDIFHTAMFSLAIVGAVGILVFVGLGLIGGVMATVSHEDRIRALEGK